MAERLIKAFGISVGKTRRRAADDVITIRTAFFYEGDRGKFIHDHFRICGAGVPVSPHFIQVFILVADGFEWRIYNPSWKENDAVELAFFEVDGDADAGAGGFIPGDLKDVICQSDDRGFLVGNPSSTHNAAVNAIAEGICILNVNLVPPAVFIGINEVFAYQVSQRIPGSFFGFHNHSPSCRRDIFLSHPVVGVLVTRFIQFFITLAVRSRNYHPVPLLLILPVHFRDRVLQMLFQFRGWMRT